VLFVFGDDTGADHRAFGFVDPRWITRRRRLAHLLSLIAHFSLRSSPWLRA
jgi:hypothetical protein